MINKRKHIISFFIALSLCISLFGCGSTESNENTENKQTEQTTSSETTVTTTTAEPETTTKKSTTTTSKTTTTTTVTTTAAPKVSYMGDRDVFYKEEDHVHQVVWSFSDQNNNHMAAEADITISITNDNGELVYEKTTHVTESDFSNWSNRLRDTDMYLGCIEIPDDEITPGASDEGILTISAKGISFSFGEGNYKIRNLPIRRAEISTPAVPLQVSALTWKGEIDTTLEISEIQTIYEDRKITLKFKCTMVYNKDGALEAQSGRFGYRLKDKDGVIIDSGTVYTSALKLGDTTYAEQTFYSSSLDISKDYDLELWNDE